MTAWGVVVGCSFIYLGLLGCRSSLGRIADALEKIAQGKGAP